MSDTMEHAISLHSSLNIGNLKLSNRIVMAPLTRCRALIQRTPNDLMAEYYSQRATAGLIITEATNVSNKGFLHEKTSGIYNLDQIQGWELVTEEVHKKGGKIFHTTR